MRTFHDVKSCNFLGVYAADLAPASLPDNATHYPCAYVVNTDPSTKPGQHWVAFYSSAPSQTIEFFDSYGNKPSAYPHIRLPTNVPAGVYSNIAFQSKRSAVCGHYCIFYLVKRAVARWPRTLILHTLSRFKHSVQPGIPYPQDKLVRRFVTNTVRQLDVVHCVSNLHRCGGGQCCAPSARCKS